MFVIPKVSSKNSIFSKRYERGNIIYDNEKKMSDIEKKYQPYVSQLNGLIKEVNTEIASNRRKSKEMLDMFPKKVEIEMESAKTRSSLYTTKLNILKMLMGAQKEIKELEMKERKLIYDTTGKNIDIKGGATSEKVFAAREADRVTQNERRSIHALPSYSTDSESEVEEVVQPTVSESKEDTSSVNVSEYVVPETEDSRFVGIFDEPKNTDSSKYVQGNKNMDTYNTIDENFSYGSAEVGIKNKYMKKTEQKCHYDFGKNIGWIRTYDTETGEITKEEALVPPEYHGVITVAQSGNVRYAIDEIDNNYDIVEDSFDNAPEAIKNELLTVYNRTKEEE